MKTPDELIDWINQRFKQLDERLAVANKQRSGYARFASIGTIMGGALDDIRAMVEEQPR